MPALFLFKFCICILLTLCVFVVKLFSSQDRITRYQDMELPHGNTQQQILAQVVGGSPILGFRYNVFLVLYFNLLLSFQLALHRDGMFLFKFLFNLLLSFQLALHRNGLFLFKFNMYIIDFMCFCF